MAAPSASITSTVTVSGLVRRRVKSLTSLIPSRLGEKNRTPRSSTTGAAPFRRCATKNAPNVAPTRQRKATRTSQVKAGAPGASRRRVLAEDHHDVGVLAEGAGVG